MKDNVSNFLMTVAAVAIVVFVLVYVAKNVDVNCINFFGLGKTCTAVVH